MCTRTFLTRTRLCSQLMSHSTAVRFCRGHLSCQSCLLIRRTTLSASMYFSNNKNNKTKQDKQRCNSVLDVNFMNVCEQCTMSPCQTYNLMISMSHSPNDLPPKKLVLPLRYVLLNNKHNIVSSFWITKQNFMLGVSYQEMVHLVVIWDTGSHSQSVS